MIDGQTSICGKTACGRTDIEAAALEWPKTIATVFRVGNWEGKKSVGGSR